MTPRAEAAGRPSQFRLSPDERRQIKAAMQVTRQNFSEFVRDAALTRADECLDPRGSRPGRLAVLTPSGVVQP
ncbi:MAG: DUF1778 domain-containing protein [Pseudomonadota bacterium]